MVSASDRMAGGRRALPPAAGRAGSARLDYAAILQEDERLGDRAAESGVQHCVVCLLEGRKRPGNGTVIKGEVTARARRRIGPGTDALSGLRARRSMSSLGRLARSFL